MTMHKLSRREVQNVELAILDYFVGFCEEHSLTYYLCGGTLLGAVRHKGFIPWDDDVDVCMPRPDYERLYRLVSEGERLPQTTRYHFQDYRQGLTRPFMKLFDTRTVVKRPYSTGAVGSSLWLDILPVDGLPANAESLKQIYRKRDFLDRLLRISFMKPLTGKTCLHALGKTAIWLFMKPIGSRRLVNAINRLAEKCPYGSTPYVGIVTAGRYGPGERMSKDAFEVPIEVDFEGRRLATFSCWDQYLTGIYGDYMTPPDASEIEDHITDAWMDDGWSEEKQ